MGELNLFAGYFLNELAKSSVATFTTFFSTFDSAINLFSFFSHAAPSIGNSTVCPNNDEYPIAFGRTDECTGCAVRPLHVDRHVVLDFNLVKTSELAKAAHARGHSAKPLQRVQIVQTLVEQNAAAFTAPSRAPSAARVVSLGAKPVGVDPIDA